MRVEKEEQTPSGPFWMGCTKNIKEYDYARKAPYTGAKSKSSRLKSNYVSLIIGFSVILKIYALIT